MNTKFFAYNPQNESALEAAHNACDSFESAALDALRRDYWGVSLREITADDLPTRYIVRDQDGVEVSDYTRREDADAEAAELTAEEGVKHTAEAAPDESQASIGDYGLWVTRRSHGNNRYNPAGIDHPDFRVSGEDSESCLRAFERPDGAMHTQYSIIVAEATFDDEGNLIEADGVSASSGEE
jgi:hypothetical protein